MDFDFTDRQVHWRDRVREFIDRKIRPVGEAYRTIIQEWSNILPAQSMALVLPVDLPGVKEPWDYV